MCVLGMNQCRATLLHKQHKPRAVRGGPQTPSTFAERTSPPARAAAPHALSPSRSVLRTDHLRTDPSYGIVVLDGRYTGWGPQIHQIHCVSAPASDTLDTHLISKSLVTVRYTGYTGVSGPNSDTLDTHLPSWVLSSPIGTERYFG